MGGKIRSVYSPHRPGEIGNNGYAKLGGKQGVLWSMQKR